MQHVRWLCDCTSGRTAATSDVPGAGAADALLFNNLLDIEEGQPTPASAEPRSASNNAVVSNHVEFVGLLLQETSLRKKALQSAVAA